MKLPGQGSGIIVIAVTGVFLFALFNLSVLGIIAAGAGALVCWAITRALTKDESPMRNLLVRMFPYESRVGEIEEPGAPGQVDSITARAMGGAWAGEREGN